MLHANDAQAEDAHAHARDGSHEIGRERTFAGGLDGHVGVEHWKARGSLAGQDRVESAVELAIPRYEHLVADAFHQAEIQLPLCGDRERVATREHVARVYHEYMAGVGLSCLLDDRGRARDATRVAHDVAAIGGEEVA